MRVNRRSFVEILIGAVAFVTVRCHIGPSVRQPSPISCFVAGVRFHTIPTNLEVGQRLLVREELFRGKRALAICTRDCVRVGFVPRNLVARLEGLQIPGALVVALDRYAVPWKSLMISFVTERLPRS